MNSHPICIDPIGDEQQLNQLREIIKADAIRARLEEDPPEVLIPVADWGNLVVRRGIGPLPAIDLPND